LGVIGTHRVLQSRLPGRQRDVVSNAENNFRAISIPRATKGYRSHQTGFSGSDVSRGYLTVPARLYGMWFERSKHSGNQGRVDKEPQAFS
jgi:hypothetical protein